jgi:hypothetical protein
MGGSDRYDWRSTMRRTVLPISIAGALFAAAPATVWAHHSHAMFDTSKEETIEGTVKGFAFANPHVYLFLITDRDGKSVPYAVEMSFVQNMERQGIGATTFKPGDKVSVRVNPLKDGRPGGSYTGAVDAAGHKHGSMANG